MKKILLLLPVLLGLLASVTSCRHHDHDDDYYYYDDGYYYDDPYWHDHYYNDPYYDRWYDHYYDYYYPEDHNCYNYIRGGRWYPATHNNFTDYEYYGYIVFNDWEILHYNSYGERYDRGRYKYDNGHIYITYDNGDHVHYFINVACNGKLILRCDNGQELQYIRR